MSNVYRRWQVRQVGQSFTWIGGQVPLSLWLCKMRVLLLLCLAERDLLPGVCQDLARGDQACQAGEEVLNLGKLQRNTEE